MKSFAALVLSVLMLIVFSGCESDESTNVVSSTISQVSDTDGNFEESFSNVENQNKDYYIKNYIAESEEEQSAINTYFNFLDGNISAKNIAPNKAEKSNEYLYINNLNRRNLTLTGIDQFAFFDLNDDGIPELVTESYTINVFSYSNGELAMIYESPAGSSSQKYLLANKKIFWSLFSTGVSYEIASFDKDLNVTIETYFDGKTEQEGDEEIFYYNGNQITESEFYKHKSEFFAPHFFAPPDTVWYTYDLSNKQLAEIVAQNLGVPNDINVTYEISKKFYWDAGERYFKNVSFYENEKLVATASVDPVTGELIKNIYLYQN